VIVIGDPFTIEALQDILDNGFKTQLIAKVEDGIKQLYIVRIIYVYGGGHLIAYQAQGYEDFNAVLADAWVQMKRKQPYMQDAIEQWKPRFQAKVKA